MLIASVNDKYYLQLTDKNYVLVRGEKHRCTGCIAERNHQLCAALPLGCSVHHGVWKEV